MTAVATPARRARARRDPAVLLPPAPPRTRRDIAGLHVRVNGVPYLVGPNLVADATNETELTIEGASTVTLTVRDIDGELANALTQEKMLLSGGVRVVIDDLIYVLTSASGGGDDRTTPLTFMDEAAWRLTRFTSYLSGASTSRRRITDGEFVLRLVDEASRRPHPPMRAFIPELRDRLRIAKPQDAELDTGGRRGRPSSGGGLGDSQITVKGKKATAKQRRTIDEGLAEAHELRASRRVMIAVVMALTQESRAGEETGQTGNDDTGVLHQGRNWLSEKNSRKPGPAVRAFLLGPDSGLGGTARGWKQIHGSVRTAPGDLDAAIRTVQVSVGGYRQWQDEAEKTVDAWRGGDADSGERTYVKSFRYHRGERDGERESSWQAIGRMASDEGRGKRRWAALNTLHYVSERELQAAAPALEIHGDEAFIVSPPAWEWGSVGRPVNEVTMTVLSERWDVLPGAVVLLASQGFLNGRWLVANVRDLFLSPETVVTLHRPAALGTEPAAETGTSSTDSGGDGAAVDKLLAACKHIDGQDRAYKYGGGHGAALSKIGPNDPLDCSSAVSLALKRAGMFEGDTAITSGQFASSWGKAGKGRSFTVLASSTHVYIRFEAGEHKRFDTAGGPPSGPHLRDTGRGDAYERNMTERHWPGT